MMVFLCVLLFIIAILFIMVFPRASRASDLPSLKVLSTPTCPACAKMYRVLDELGDNYGDKVKTEKINLLEHLDIAKEFNVRSVPYLLFCDRDGKVVKEKVGYITIDKVLAEFKDTGIDLE